MAGARAPILRRWESIRHHRTTDKRAYREITLHATYIHAGKLVPFTLRFRDTRTLCQSYGKKELVLRRSSTHARVERERERERGVGGALNNS